jgi:hypothetical protein
MTPLEKNIYNNYLVTRKYQNKPFKLKKNWEGFENDKNYTHIQKLSRLFEKFKMTSTNDVERYFYAPYGLYGNKDFYDLKWYSSQKAISTYSKYKKRLELSVDSDEMIEKIKKSLLFIAEYCENNDIKLKDYINYVENDFCTFSFMKHIKEGKISIYCMFYFDDFESLVSSIEPEERNVLFGNIIENFREYKMAYWNSLKLRKIINKGMKILEKNI